MITVTSRELRIRLGKYLRLVRGGELVCVTGRGQPVACIVPLAGADDLIQLISKGGITLGTGRLRPSKPVVLTPGLSTTEMIAEDRR